MGDIKEEPYKWGEIKLPKPNLTLQVGNLSAPIFIHIAEEKTLVNRFKWWFASKFFPFKIESWEDMK